MNANIHILSAAKIILWLICCFYISLYAIDVDDFYKGNKSQIITDRCLVSCGYVFVTGKAVIRSSSVSSFSMAKKQAAIDLEKNIARLKINSIENFPVTAGLLKDNICSGWLNITPLKYTVKGRIDIDSFQKGNVFYCVAAYKLTNIEFEDKTPISWERIYNDFKNNPDKRNELLFFEIIPEKEISAMQNAVEAKLIKQYGKNFALMFFGKKITSIDKEKYESTKKYFAKCNSATSLQLLINALNRVPYDSELCNILAEKFTAMQMPRCAKVMKLRAGEKDKLLFLSPENERKKTETLPEKIENKIPAKQPENSVKKKSVVRKSGNTNFLQML